ncbi:MARVEL domain-containing protein 3 isoform X1 [Brachyhypopomus gauderio]|uniref:MARVEL domain-containing protein 3 isoform X1 n=1 Tax=Brachyhypopomus gauderio TaxID=698409 RepID=UPI0040419877
MSDPPRRHRGQRDRTGHTGHQNHTRDHRSTPPSNHRSSNQRHYSRNSSSHSRNMRSVPSEVRESKWTYICSRRGIVLICAVLTNLLVLFCVVAAQVTLSGMSAANFGGSFVDTVIPFEGVELQQVRELDMQFGQMRAPGVYGGVVFSLVFGVVSLLFVLSNNKPAYALPRKLLIGQFAFQAIGAVVYVIAVGLYLHFVIQVNSTDTCAKRERLYARNGYTWMNCSVSGADAAVALFAIITTLLYVLGAVFTGITLRNVIRYEQERSRGDAELPAKHSQTRNPPDRSDMYI